MTVEAEPDPKPAKSLDPRVAIALKWLKIAGIVLANEGDPPVEEQVEEMGAG